MSGALRFLFDVGVGRAAESALRQAGHDVLAARERDLSMQDEDMLRWAVEEGRILVTVDADLGKLALHSGLAHAGVLLLRLEEASGAEKARVVRAVVDQYGEQLAGCFAVYQKGRLRLRSGT